MPLKMRKVQPSGQQFEPVEMLVDTGATFTKAPRELLERLGVALESTYTAELADVSRASTKHTSGAEQKCTTREVIGQRKCPRQLFGRSVTEAGWQQAGRVSE